MHFICFFEQSQLEYTGSMLENFQAIHANNQADRSTSTYYPSRLLADEQCSDSFNSIEVHIQGMTMASFHI